MTSSETLGWRFQRNSATRMQTTAVRSEGVSVNRPIRKYETFLIATSLIEIALALAPRVVNVNDFQFCVEIERGRALLECADACGLDAAEGDVRLAACRRRIDVRHSRLNLF